MVASLNLSPKEIKTIKQALKKMPSIEGIGDMGPRSEEILARYEQGQTDVSLPEWNTIGFALSRLDTNKGYKLLNRLTDEITK
jgi:hypothetical protein